MRGGSATSRALATLRVQADGSYKKTAIVALRL